MAPPSNIIYLGRKDRVTLEPDLAHLQHMSKEQVLLAAQRFYRWSKQCFKLYDIRVADELWTDEAPAPMAQRRKKTG